MIGLHLPNMRFASGELAPHVDEQSIRLFVRSSPPEEYEEVVVGISTTSHLSTQK
jgi:hypothetical protein